MRSKKIKISKIDIGDRVREEVGDIKKLAQSIEDIGLLNPITVQKTGSGRYHLVAGERRLKACKRLDWDKIRATVFEEDENGS